MRDLLHPLAADREGRFVENPNTVVVIGEISQEKLGYVVIAHRIE
jgi:hypothetical protein